MYSANLQANIPQSEPFICWGISLTQDDKQHLTKYANIINNFDELQQSTITPLSAPAVNTDIRYSLPVAIHRVWKNINQVTFLLPARRYASAGYRDRNVSVRLSVCHAPVLCQNEES